MSERDPDTHSDFFSKSNPLHHLLERDLLNEGSQVISESKKIYIFVFINCYKVTFDSLNFEYICFAKYEAFSFYQSKILIW